MTARKFQACRSNQEACGGDGWLLQEQARLRAGKGAQCLTEWTLGAQVEWLQPYTDAKIRELGAAGVRGLLAVPISFVSEHIETLEEIDMEYRELAHESGIPAWGRVPALNTNATFIDDLAELVLEKLPSTALRLGAASPAEDHNLGPPSGARGPRAAALCPSGVQGLAGRHIAGCRP